MEFQKNLIAKPDEKIIYKTVGDLKLPMNVYYPVDGIKGKMPCVLCVHGGAWKTDIKPNEEFEKSWMDMNAKYYAQAGMVGIAISYRNIDDENTDIFDLISDCEDAMRYIKEKLDYVDNDKIIAIGDSAGGHLVSCLGISQNDDIRPELVIACNPVLDCTKEKWHYCTDTDEKRKLASPIYNIGNNASKFLCMHGDKDTVVEIEDTFDFANELKNKGFVSEMIVEEGKTHAFVLFDYQSTDEDAIKYMEQTMEFINRNL